MYCQPMVMRDRNLFVHKHTVEGKWEGKSDKAMHENLLKMSSVEYLNQKPWKLHFGGSF